MDNSAVRLRWASHQGTVLSVFDALLASETLVDVTLAADGQYIRAHKILLSACSPYFQDLLALDHSKTPIIFLKDVKFSELKALVQFIYRGEVSITQDALLSFLAVAQALQIRGLASLDMNKPSNSVGSDTLIIPDLSSSVNTNGSSHTAGPGAGAALPGRSGVNEHQAVPTTTVHKFQRPQTQGNSTQSSIQADQSQNHGPSVPISGSRTVAPVTSAYPPPAKRLRSQLQDPLYLEPIVSIIEHEHPSDTISSHEFHPLHHAGNTGASQSQDSGSIQVQESMTEPDESVFDCEDVDVDVKLDFQDGGEVEATVGLYDEAGEDGDTSMSQSSFADSIMKHGQEELHSFHQDSDNLALLAGAIDQIAGGSGAASSSNRRSSAATGRSGSVVDDKVGAVPAGGDRSRVDFQCPNSNCGKSYVCKGPGSKRPPSQCEKCGCKIPPNKRNYPQYTRHVRYLCPLIPPQFKCQYCSKPIRLRFNLTKHEAFCSRQSTAKKQLKPA